MNNIDKQYTELLQDILDNGISKQDRTGTGTISVFGRQIRHKMSEGFPLLTTKKMPFKPIVTELLWFLRGDTNIKYLVDNGCHIWDGDSYKNYLKWFDKLSKSFKEQGIVREPWTKEQYIEQIKLGNVDADLSDLGPIYGKQWRNWKTNYWIPKAWLNEDGEIVVRGENNIKLEYDEIDQIANLISELKTNPDSRRLMVNAWNVGELDQMVLPPCHYGFQVYTRELSAKERLFFVNKSDDEYNKALSNKEQYKSIGLDFELALTSRMNELNIPTRAISLMWSQRSVDTFLGLPFNIASYGLLLEIIAKEVNMVPDELIGNLGDVHLYSNHIEQAREQIGREPFELPKLGMDYREGEYNKDLKDFTPDDFYLINYQSHPAIKAPLSN
jgi:thymidylate synthase